MEYQKFPSIMEARRDVPYPLVDVPELLGIKRLSSIIRWLSRTDDMLFQSFIQFVPSGPNLIASNYLVFVQGHGSRVNLETAGAAEGNFGHRSLPDGRGAWWVRGVPDADCAWITWESNTEKGSLLRIEGRGFDFKVLETVAATLSESEA